MSRYGEYIRGWKQKQKRDEEQLQQKRHRAKKTARECARILYNDYEVDAVYMVGSMVNPGDFHDGSDVDLAVQGLAPREYFPALSDCSRTLPIDQTMDLITLEDVEDQDRTRLRKQGKLVTA